MPIIFKNPGRRRRNAMLEMDYEEIDDLPILANPRRNGMARRRNGMRKNTSRDKNSNRAKARRKYQKLSMEKNDHARWYDDKQLFIAYQIEVKTNANSPRSKAELREFAEEKWANRGR